GGPAGAPARHRADAAGRAGARLRPVEPGAAGARPARAAGGGPRGAAVRLGELPGHAGHEAAPGNATANGTARVARDGPEPESSTRAGDPPMMRRPWSRTAVALAALVLMAGSEKERKGDGAEWHGH